MAADLGDQLSAAIKALVSAAISERMAAEPAAPAAAASETPVLRIERADPDRLDRLRAFTVTEVAERLRCEREFVRRLVDRGELTGYVLYPGGRDRRISAKSLEAYLDRRDKEAQDAHEASRDKLRRRLKRA